MVRLIPVAGKNGATTWVEDAPTACGRGHRRLGAKWGQCPLGTCRAMVRLWDCREPDCDEVLVDDEHVHRVQPPPGVHQGG